MKTLHELEAEMDLAEAQFTEAARRGDCEACDQLTDFMLDLACELNDIANHPARQSFCSELWE